MIEYVGERLWAGYLGNTFVILAFVAALLATVSYALGAIKGDKNHSWRKIARSAFFVHTFSAIGIVVTLLIMLANNMFEYHYIWQHSNSDMQMRYIFSAFWEGQEGSTILWVFWHSIVGLILLYTAKKWEYRVMAVFSSAQVMLLTMILGVFIFEKQFGSNPFTMLLRHHPDFANLPFLQNPNYIQTIDGSGLNPLLKNYWMTIHPPTLFLGFALTLVPFSYAVASLWKGSYKKWVKPTIPWAYAGVGVLGLGILMGGAWAYESLSFGGFWAWDPVENASLVPWLTLVGGAHLLLIQRNKGASLVWSFILLILTFFMILYSTFLTKSGVLGDTSVHAFTDLGLSGQLVFYFAFYGILGFGLLIYRLKDIPRKKEEDSLWSREFWMFVGALILLLAGFQITFSTSIPVWNKLFGTEMAPPADPIEHYNSFQLPFAIVIAFVIGFTQYLNYRKTNFRNFISKVLRDVIIGLAFTIAIGLGMGMKDPLLLLLLFATLFALAANVDYLFRSTRIQRVKSGSAIAHIGFLLVLMGALISNGNKEIISENTSQYDLKSLDTNYSNKENILLMLDDTMEMAQYNVVFRGKEKEGIHVHYNVDYLDKETNEKKFTLRPFVQLNERMGNVAEPSTRHYWNKDIFTYIKYAELEDRKEPQSDSYEEPQEFKVSIGDTIYANSAIFVFDTLKVVQNKELRDSLELHNHDLLVKAELTAFDFDTKSHKLETYFGTRGSKIVTIPDVDDNLYVKVDLFNIDPDEEQMEFRIFEKKNKIKEFIIMQAMIFPYINILWIGAILMVIGTVIAIVSRLVKKRKSS